MTNQDLGDDSTDVWLVDASRRLDEPSGDVARLVSSITAGLPRLRRPGRDLDTDDERVRINDRVVKQLLATRVRTGSGRLVVHVQLHGDDAALAGVSIGLIARYRDDLQAGAERVRDAVRAVLTDSVGPEAAAEASANIHVRWQDVYTREWLN